MKKITIITIIFGSLVFASCKKWLSVQPEGQATKDETFSTQKGFRDALTGAYLHLKDANLYGGAMTWTTIEFLARNWDNVSVGSTFYTNLANANYTDASVRTAVDNIYAAEYKVVADVNSILEKIDGKKTIFTEDNYALIKGEALTLRAFAHFDVLRMFGPMPDNAGTLAILPYVKEVSNQVIVPVNYTMFVQNILADLDEAEALMKAVDPFTFYSRAELNPVANNFNTPPVLNDDYYMYRQIRMNYYAVLALKARVYLWLKPLGSEYVANAAKYAQMVVDAKDHNGAFTFRLGTAAERTSGDFTMSPEHIMALSIYDLEQKAISSFGESGILARSDFNIQDGFYYLNNLFPVAERTFDIRWLGMWQYKTNAAQTSFVKYNKFIQRTSQPILQLPLLRLSEMYLILTECAQSKQEAEGFYAKFCEAKGVPFTTGFNATNWESDRRNKLIREYVREFYAEGQSFFAYKRLNVTTLPATWTASSFTGNPARYIVPKPDREINYHNK